MRIEKARKEKQKKMRNRFIFRSVVLLILVGALAFTLITNLSEEKIIYGVGDEAPDFLLKQISNNNELEEVRLSDYRGRGVMLNFWATYCKPCEAEMPYMEQLYPEYSEKGVEIIAVNLQEAPLVVNRFVDKYDLTFPIPHDNRGDIRTLYQIGKIPSTYFIDSNGVIIEKVEGALTLQRLEQSLNQIMP